MYIFGGINLAQQRFNDVHEFNFETNTWTRRIALDLEPTSRTFHQSVILAESYLYVFGGFDGMKRNDIYRVKLENNVLKRLGSHEEEKEKFEWLEEGKEVMIKPNHEINKHMVVNQEQIFYPE